MDRRWMLPFGYGGLPASAGQSRDYGADPFLQLHREMNRLFDDVIRQFGLPMTRPSGTAGAGPAAMMAPVQIDVSETDEAVTIRAELPGVRQEDVEVTLDGEVLTIRGEKKAESGEEQPGRNWHVTERSYGAFARSLRLPYPIDPEEEVRASFDNGVLTITLPKPQERQRPRSRRIEVKPGTGEAEAKPQRVARAKADRAAAGSKPGAATRTAESGDKPKRRGARSSASGAKTAAKRSRRRAE